MKHYPFTQETVLFVTGVLRMTRPVKRSSNLMSIQQGAAVGGTAETGIAQVGEHWPNPDAEWTRQYCYLWRALLLKIDNGNTQGGLSEQKE